MKVKLRVQLHKSVSFETKTNIRFQYLSFVRNQAKWNSPPKIDIFVNFEHYYWAL